MKTYPEQQCRPLGRPHFERAAMTGKAIRPAVLNDVAAMVGLSVKDANKASISALLLSIRERVMRKAEMLPAEKPPVLAFDPR